MRIRRVVQAAGMFALLFVAAPTKGASSDSVSVESRSPAAAKGRLVEDIGIETLGGVFTPLLEHGRTIPCEVTETFSTAADNQFEIEIRPFRGVAKLAREAKPLGRFVVGGLPRGPRGTVMVAVTFAVSADGTITLAAKEKAGRPIHLRRRDG
jgi:molecular chaperone DnaK (HSP70)